MFEIDADKTIHLTRGDIATIEVSTKDKATGEAHVFKAGDVVRLRVNEKKDYGRIMLMKDVAVTGDTTVVAISLNKEDTKIGELISKPRDFYYEIEVNPETAPQTIIGHDREGAKVLRLYPEGSDEFE
jgi:hypothetical protein